MNRVRALSRDLDNRVGLVVHDIQVIAFAAQHHVSTCAAVNGVGRAIAAEHVGQFIAGDAGGRAQQNAVFHVRRQREGHAADHHVAPARLACGFDDGVHIVFKQVGVVAVAARQRVRAFLAIQGVIARAAGEQVGCVIALQVVVQFVAGGVDGGCAGQDQVLDIGAQGVADAGFHRVYAFAGQFGHYVQGVVHLIEVVTLAAQHQVCAGATGQAVITTQADQCVVTGPTGELVVFAIAGDGVGQAVAGAVDDAYAFQDQVFDIGAQREAHHRLDCVAAFVEFLDRFVQNVVHVVAVVAFAACHGVGAQAAVHQILSNGASD